MTDEPDRCGDCGGPYHGPICRAMTDEPGLRAAATRVRAFLEARATGRGLSDEVQTFNGIPLNVADLEALTATPAATPAASDGRLDVRAQVQSWRDGAQQRHDRMESEREWRKVDRIDGEITAYDEVLAYLEAAISSSSTTETQDGERCADCGLTAEQVGRLTRAER